MCIRLRSCPPVEGKEKKIKKRGSRRVIVLTVINALFFAEHPLLDGYVFKE